jgi:hypothetical protein
MSQYASTRTKAAQKRGRGLREARRRREDGGLFKDSVICSAPVHNDAARIHFGLLNAEVAIIERECWGNVLQ